MLPAPARYAMRCYARALFEMLRRFDDFRLPPDAMPRAMMLRR